MKKIFAIVSVLALFVCSSCNELTLSGNSIKKQFDIEGTYTKLRVDNSFEVTVSDEATQITVTADENVMPKVVVTQVGDELRIYLKPLTVNALMDLEVVLPYNPDLKSVELSGASEYHSEHALKGDKVEVELSGASDIYCDIEATNAELDLSGASDIEGNIAATNLDLDLSGASKAKITGQVSNLKLDLSGASHLTKKVIDNQFGFACDKCEGEISGASDAYIHCDGTIKVNLSGASNLYYTGNASTTDSNTSGASNIVHETL